MQTLDDKQHIEKEQEHDELTESKIEETSDIEEMDDEEMAEKTPQDSVDDSVVDSARTGEEIIFDELPSRWLIAGGLRPVPYLSTIAVVFILMFTYGFNDYYSVYFSYEGDDKEYVDCARVQSLCEWLQSCFLILKVVLLLNLLF